MIVIFEKDELRLLYEFGRNPDRKHRFQPDIIRRYQKAVNFLKAAYLETLWHIHSLNYEVLSGYKAGRSSVRVNDQYRIYFTVHMNNNELSLNVNNIFD